MGGISVHINISTLANQDSDYSEPTRSVSWLLVQPWYYKLLTHRCWPEHGIDDYYDSRKSRIILRLLTHKKVIPRSYGRAMGWLFAKRNGAISSSLSLSSSLSTSSSSPSSSSSSSLSSLLPWYHYYHYYHHYYHSPHYSLFLFTVAVIVHCLYHYHRYLTTITIYHHKYHHCCRYYRYNNYCYYHYHHHYHHRYYRYWSLKRYKAFDENFKNMILLWSVYDKI